MATEKDEAYVIPTSGTTGVPKGVPITHANLKAFFGGMVGGGVWELKLDFGPGYRVYFGQDGADLVRLLVGGDKTSQRKDISKAQQYWTEYKNGDKDVAKKRT